MDRLIFTAYSGMVGSTVRQRVIASNMANAQTIGFRAELLNATPMTLKGPSLEARAMTEGEVRGASMKQGTLIATGKPLDVALTGDTMLSVQAEDGTEVYTRRGDLAVSAGGVLQNGDGRPVIGETGPITVPLGSKVTISPDGGVSVANPETPDQPPQLVGRIKIASTVGTKIDKGLDGLFRVSAPEGGVLPQDEEARLMVGSLEQSNVDPTRVLVEMVEAQRLFDMRTKVVAQAREIDESSAGLMRIS
ncbi:MAG: flagellar biosynthesis protein FlgF [Novosphingobium sp. 28-62-57]|uniref:flagellar basal body rod protein FlgF n=1 Tax=unclassified Novosphingobium TaxID=2644732 RepID=UPI000BCC4750|nr:MULTISPECIES: flagellar basal body rod protein FlgF [unclassified Novosphingobium]OYW47571.1 MAG: flagellar biosynthesis protein FlgF [Novosphingobium sp. 12-63-9]OYZ08802.1 MAG: flagellar biosynthesis protein FlgF [Novosphingobium sp. 28-62-57]OZA37657.1 MAG: flagellar biosynthesis protein FlgF [Novosphingobium sp. 17-62-9]HQS70196.1 flagellar basal body rod protein FlgF [Novosphingobium sp.]